MVLATLRSTRAWASGSSRSRYTTLKETKLLFMLPRPPARS